MFISLNEEKIILHFNPSPFLKISGPDELYYVELREYPKNDDQSLYVEGRKIVGNGGVFHIPIEFYCDFEISVSKYISEYGLKKIFTHRFNDYGKQVLFNLDTNNHNECLLWISKVEDYQKIHGCNIHIKTNFDDINKKFMSYYQVNGIDYYKSYNIGRTPKSSTDWRTIDPRKEGVVWYGNWKTFWSYQHPRLWSNLSSEEIINDILAL
jgi:hypothetical protein